MSRFVNQRVVSRGGMATIYRADDTQSGMTVALKEVLEGVGFSDSMRKQLQKRLEREAKTLARLDHPNIVKYLGTAEQDGHVYIVTEFLLGTTLEQEIVSGRMVGKRDQILSVFQQVCRGMEYARRCGVVHRDIKPANIFVCNGQVKLIDFGIARLIDGVSMTSDEQILGTPHYMSPEQTLGARSVDSRGDVFSTGVCLYHTATGELPFNGRGREDITNAIRTQQMPQGRLWPELEPVVERALSKDPGDRWQTFEDFERALAAVASGVVVPAQSISADPPAASQISVPSSDARSSRPIALEPPRSPAPQTGPFDPLTGSQAARPPAEGSPTWRYVLSGVLGVFALLFLSLGPLGVLLAMGAMGGAVTLIITAPGSSSMPGPAPSPPQMGGSIESLPVPAFAPLPRQAPGGRRVCYSVNGMSMVSKPSDTDVFVVGRSDSAHIRIPNDTRVSGDHAKVTVSPDGTIAYEDHSTNGSFVGGQRVGRIGLRSGGEVRLGSTTLRFDSVT